jgi:signal transduction histidine kinase
MPTRAMSPRAMSTRRPFRERLTRPARADVAIALALGAVLLAGSAAAASGQDRGPLRPLGLLGYALIALSCVALAWRNAAPTATLLVTLVLGVGYESASYPGGPAPLAVVAALYTLAAHGHRLRALGLGLAATALLVGGRALFTHGLESPLLVAFPTTVVAALFAGQLVAGRRARRVEGERQRVETERAREVDTQRRVDAERLRIARELHDVVAHNISLINVQATMGVHLMETRPAEAAAALGAIKTASKQALRELRAILDVLRQADEDEPTRPTSGLAEVDSLARSTRLAGLPVEVVVVGDRRPVPSSVDVAAFRIIQESLTNALRYSGGAPTRVSIDYHPQSLVIDIVDDGDCASGGDGSGPGGAGLGGAGHSGAGHGIAGMTERAAAVGGTLRAGPIGAGGFGVHARLPLGSVAS